jgi:hypothetical protein
MSNARVPVVPMSMPRKSLMIASGELISSANYICWIGLHVKWQFLEIQVQGRKKAGFFSDIVVV